MSRLTDLLRQVEGKDQRLAEDLRREFAQLSKRRAFGLNFERHVPESVELPGRPVRKGDKVRFVHERGQSAAGLDRRLWQVTGFRNEAGERIAELARRDSPEAELESSARAVADLVVVAEFRDPIFPGLKSVARVTRGDDKPFHTVINAENYHALQALLYTHEGRVDAIYIDPPYNTGARDWKYNNDYVDGDDAYRHSKWLAMMERRLKLAKRLLNPADSVLIVTIDEKEYLRLGLLLEQVFPEASIQMISSVISPGGVPREREFTRVNEFIFFVMLGISGPKKIDGDLLYTAWKTEEANRSPIWRGLLRGGSGPFRADSPLKFYPVLVDPNSERIVSAGDPLPLNVDRSTFSPPLGLVAVWPLKKGGEEGRWELAKSTFLDRLDKGFVRLGNFNRKTQLWSVNYLRKAEIDRLESGELIATGRAKAGHLEIEYAEGRARKLYPKTVWNEPSHDAGTHGVAVCKALLQGRKFDYPKSVYAVEDSLKCFVGEKINSTILDFFSGSGTTCHAVMRLNKQDGGKRQCISITNNEVSADEQKNLREQGLRPGEPDWEKLGICEYITQPRIAAAITGKTPDGEPIKGDYKFTDEFPMAQGFEENVEFFKLTYEAPRPVAHHRAFQAIAPLLWLKAGAQGQRIDEPTEDFAVVERYGILFDLDRVGGFVAALEEAESARMAFIVTDDDRGFQSVCRELPTRVEPVRLYESYLKNFTINSGRE